MTPPRNESDHVHLPKSEFEALPEAAAEKGVKKALDPHRAVVLAAHQATTSASRARFGHAEEGLEPVNEAVPLVMSLRSVTDSMPGNVDSLARGSGPAACAAFHGSPLWPHRPTLARIPCGPASWLSLAQDVALPYVRYPGP